MELVDRVVRRIVEWWNGAVGGVVESSNRGIVEWWSNWWPGVVESSNDQGLEFIETRA